jgi:hypothetical protein
VAFWGLTYVFGHNDMGVTKMSCTSIKQQEGVGDRVIDCQEKW